jgi:hypothetical protein
LPPLVNEIISDVLAVGVAVVQALQGGQLGGSPTSDFAIVASYTLVVMHTPVFQSFQKQVQSNVLNIGGKAPVQAQAAPALDIPSLALAIVRNIDITNLVAMLRDEMIKASRQAQQTMSAPTVPQMPIVRTNTPPVQQTPQQAVQPQYAPVQQPPVNWMNGSPGTAAGFAQAQAQQQPANLADAQNAWQQLQQPNRGG